MSHKLKAVLKWNDVHMENIVLSHVTDEWSSNGRYF